LQISDDLNVCVGYPRCATSAVVPLIIGSSDGTTTYVRVVSWGARHVQDGFSRLLVVVEL
jgi:hypothetical protein